MEWSCVNKPCSPMNNEQCKNDFSTSYRQWGVRNTTTLIICSHSYTQSIFVLLDVDYVLESNMAIPIWWLRLETYTMRLNVYWCVPDSPNEEMSIEWILKFRLSSLERLLYSVLHRLKLIGCSRFVIWAYFCNKRNSNWINNFVNHFKKFK